LLSQKQNQQPRNHLTKKRAASFRGCRPFRF